MFQSTIIDFISDLLLKLNINQTIICSSAINNWVALNLFICGSCLMLFLQYILIALLSVVFCFFFYLNSVISSLANLLFIFQDWPFQKIATLLTVFNPRVNKVEKQICVMVQIVNDEVLNKKNKKKTSTPPLSGTIIHTP